MGVKAGVPARKGVCQGLACAPRRGGGVVRTRADAGAGRG